MDFWTSWPNSTKTWLQASWIKGFKTCSKEGPAKYKQWRENLEKRKNQTTIASNARTLKSTQIKERENKCLLHTNPQLLKKSIRKKRHKKFSILPATLHSWVEGLDILLELYAYKVRNLANGHINRPQIKDRENKCLCHIYPYLKKKK